MNPDSELIRKKFLYRRLIMQRKVSLRHKSAAGLIGPDCAYHLYGQMSGVSLQKTENRSLSTVRCPDKNETNIP